MSPLVPPSLWPALHRRVAGEPWPPSSEATAERLVARATRDAMLPLLLAEAALPPVFGEALARARARDRPRARHAAILSAALGRVSDALSGEPFVLLKGADYQHRLYPRPALRPMQDIDILVPRDRMPEVARRLAAAGFRPTPTGLVTELPSHHEKLFRLWDVEVDVHHSFVQRARTRIDYEAVWARRVPLTGPGLSTYRLADVDALVYHAVAMATDEFAVPLLRYVDFWRMLGAQPDAVAGVVERAREWGVERALYGAFRLAARVAPEFVALGVEQAAGRLLGPRGRRFLDRWVLPDPWAHGEGRRPGRRVQLWRKFWLIDGFRRRTAFALYHGHALWRARRAARPAGAPPGA